MVLVEVEVWLVTLSWGTRCVPRGSRGLILGSTGRGRPLLYPVSVFPTRYIDAPLGTARIECQVDQHFWIVTLRSIVRVASCIVGDMRKEGLVAGTVIIVGRRLDWGILHAV